jgi:carbon monoxide dehydrogenase subunit G
MAFEFGGEFLVQRSPAETYDFLSDPRRFAPLLPDYEGVEVHDAQNFTVRVKVGISHIRGSATVKLCLAEATRPQHARYTGKGSMAGGTVDLSAGFELKPAEKGTLVQWKGGAQVFGRLTSVAGGLLEPLARKNIQKVIDSLQRELEQQPASST